MYVCTVENDRATDLLNVQRGASTNKLSTNKWKQLVQKVPTLLLTAQMPRD